MNATFAQSTFLTELDTVIDERIQDSKGDDPGRYYNALAFATLVCQMLASIEIIICVRIFYLSTSYVLAMVQASSNLIENYLPYRRYKFW